MKSLRSVVLFLACSLYAGNFASATETILGSLTPTNNSVTSVMQHVGCDLGWLSQVIADSGIDAAKLRQLPVGQKVRLTNGSCTQTPPQNVARLSSLVMRVDMTDARLGVRLRNVDVENKNLHNSLDAAATTIKNLVGENSQLRVAVSDLEAKLVRLEKEKVQIMAAGGSGSFLALAVIGLIMLAIGAGLTYYILARSAKKNVTFPLVWTIEDNGKTYRFDFVGAGEAAPNNGTIVGKYKCPECSERNIFGRDGNLRKHAAQHATEKVKGVDVSFARASAQR